MYAHLTVHVQTHVYFRWMRVCVFRDAGQFNYPIFMRQKQYYARVTNER